MESSTNEEHLNFSKEHSRETATDESNKIKSKLIEDIRELKALVFQMECSLNIPKFGDIKHLFDFQESIPQPSLNKISDVETEYTDELIQFTGIHCTKFTKNECFFNFISLGTCNRDCTYAVQIISELEEPKVNKWLMPMSVNLNAILLETPLRNSMDLKPFLTNCRHHIGCYTNRIKQYNELQPIVNNLSGCSLDSNLGHTVITLTFLYMLDLDLNESNNVELYLIYESNRIRPHKITIDSLNSKPLSANMNKNLKTYFKNFKCFDLKKAFEKLLEKTNAHVEWLEGKDEDSLEDLNDSSVSKTEDRESESRESGEKEENVTSKRRRDKKQVIQHGLKRKKRDHSFETREQSLSDSDLERSVSFHLNLSRQINQKGIKSSQPKGKLQPSKSKITKALAVPQDTNEKAKPLETLKKNVKSSKNLSGKKLKQSTLKLQSKRKKNVDQEQFDNEIPLSERLSAIAVGSSKEKSKLITNVLGNREFGTSTPVSNFKRMRKNFVSDSNAEISPIRSKSIRNLKNKKNSKEPG